jgi:hypothetical protein
VVRSFAAAALARASKSSLRSRVVFMPPIIHKSVRFASAPAPR